MVGITLQKDVVRINKNLRSFFHKYIIGYIKNYLNPP